MTFWLVVGMVVAIWRLARLITVDEFPPARLPRDWIVDTFYRDRFEYGLRHAYANRGRGGPPETIWLYCWRYVGHSIAYLWTCPWCMSFWVGLGVWAIVDWATDISVPYPWLIVAAGSLASGIGASVEAGHEQRFALRQQQIDEGKGGRGR